MKKYRTGKTWVLIVMMIIICCSFSVNDEPNTGKDQLAPREVVIQFLEWYKTNYKTANGFPILVKDSVNNFMVDTVAAHNYLRYLESSKLVSARYVQYWQVFFDDKAVLLKENPMHEGIPEDFDMDFVLITQELAIVFNNTSRLRIKTVSINKDAALLRVTLPGVHAVQYEFELYKEKSGWQIGYISTPNYD